MKTSVKRHSKQLLIGILLLSLTACGSEQSLPQANGGISGILAVEQLTQGGTQQSSRPAALLGIYVSDYLAMGPFAFVQSALTGIQAQTAFAADPGGPENEDYALLQAFADALNVQLASMLNQSVNREEALNRYLEALENVALRAQTRHEEIMELEDAARDERRDQQRIVSGLKSDLNKAIRDQDFSQAGSIQESLDEEQATLSEAELRVTQLQSIERTFSKLLDIYEERSVAIENNREALIAGISVVDVPGAEDLEIIRDPDDNRPSGGFQVPTFGEQ